MGNAQTADDAKEVFCVNFEAIRRKAADRALSPHRLKPPKVYDASAPSTKRQI